MISGQDNSGNEYMFAFGENPNIDDDLELFLMTPVVSGPVDVTVSVPRDNTVPKQKVNDVLV